MIWFSNLLTLNVPDEGYYRKVSFALILIPTFLLGVKMTNECSVGRRL
jgi:hypothetical protein